MTILFVCESAGKIQKISSILGKGYKVKASYGHFRDLDRKSMSIDFEDNFKPQYVITNPKVVHDLKSSMSGIDTLYIASDGDLEGESIAQHLYDVLKPKNYKRIVFNAITKDAIMKGIKNAGEIDKNAVSAQKARRVLDRIFGYSISPLLSRQIGGSLSAGRVQSVATKLIIDKENEIINFIEKNSDSTYFRVSGVFSKLKSTLYQTAKYISEAYDGKIANIQLTDDDPYYLIKELLSNCLKSDFTVHVVFDKLATRNPAPPFETCTLQQEASRKFGFSVDMTMKVAQKLYEGGFITYMRTDSIEISKEGHDEIKKVIIDEYGSDYYQKNEYKNSSSSAQEAHEAIRPTHPELLTLEKEIQDPLQIKLYKLIWQRTIASQMKPAKINITTIQIDISKCLKSKPLYYFQSSIEKIVFAGFMKVYIESLDDVDEDDDQAMKDFKGKVPIVGQKLTMEKIIAKQEYKKPPPRYSEASLVKTLKKLGIGRPSTYVNTIKTIIDRDYVKIDNVPGIKKDIKVFTIESSKNKITEKSDQILLGKENKKIIPTSLGITVNDYLVENFPEMMDYKFTAKIETELDEIASGQKIWYKVVKNFYDRFNPIIQNLSTKTIIKNDDKLLGSDSDGNEIFVTKTKYGPAVKKSVNDKFVYAKIEPPLKLETIKLQDAIKLFAYPKILGKHDKKEVMLCKGKFGFYLKFNDKNYPTTDENIDLNSAIEIITEKNSNIIKEFDLIQNKKKVKATILKGQFGPYIQTINGKKRVNYPIPKNLSDEKSLKKLTNERVLEIMELKSKKYQNSGSKTTKTAKSTSKTAKK